MDPLRYREVLGRYPTGVVVVTAIDEHGQAHGMTVGSFTSVSLDPPLVAFLADKASSSWGKLKTAGDKFCANVLSVHQQDVCRQVAVRKSDKFTNVPWRLSENGCPVVEGAVASVDFDLEVVHDAGDHVIVIGRVTEMSLLNEHSPLLFLGGGYGSFSPLEVGAR